MWKDWRSTSSLESPLADDEGLWAALASRHHIPGGSIDLTVQQSLSRRLRDLNWQAQVALRADEIVAIGSPSHRWLQAWVRSGLY